MTSRVRSSAAAAASVRNGARSQGPCTEAGLAAASRNARKHGLFGVCTWELCQVPPLVAQLVEELSADDAGCFRASIRVEFVVEAAVRLAEATELLDPLRYELSEALFGAGDDPGRIDPLIEQIVRIARYQRRFRGQRDRALRALTRTRVSDKRSSSP